MKRFACGDVVPGCRAVWTLPSEDDILRAVAQHAADDHGISNPPAELVAAVRAKISSVA